MLAARLQETLQSYEFLGSLGRVAWGEAWRAVDTHSGGAVIVKCIPRASLAAAVQALGGAPLVEEAHALTRLVRPGLPVVYEVRGSDDGLLLVFDPPPWGSFLPRLEAVASGAVDLDRETLVEWGCELLDLLAEVHAQGALHRHLGAASVGPREGGGLSLWGFGLTRLADDPSFTPAPEALRGAPARASSDLYALASLLEKLAGGVPGPLLGSPQDDPLAEVLVRAQAIDPVHRHGDSAEMERRLRRALPAPLPTPPASAVAPVPSPPPAEAPAAAPMPPEAGEAAARGSRRPLRAVLAAVVLAAVAGMAARWLASSQPAPAPAAPTPPASAAAPAVETLEEETPAQLFDRAQRLLEAGEERAAEELLERLLAGGALDNPVPALDLLATLCLQRGETSEAAELLERAVALQPSADLHYKLGLALAAEEKPAEALEQLQQARQLDPASLQIAEAIERLGGSL